MIEMMVWLLIVNSDGGYNMGNASVLERFSTSKECQRVQTNIPSKYSVQSVCIQATILVKK